MGNPEGFVAILTADLLGQVSGQYQIKRYTTNYVDDMGNLTHLDLEFEEYENSLESGAEEAKGGSVPRMERKATIWDDRERSDSVRGEKIMEP